MRLQDTRLSAFPHDKLHTQGFERDEHGTYLIADVKAPGEEPKSSGFPLVVDVANELHI